MVIQPGQDKMHAFSAMQGNWSTLAATVNVKDGDTYLVGKDARLD
jgi:hypothetical protein